MMDATTKSWFIANFEIASFVCTVIAGAIIATIITIIKGGMAVGAALIACVYGGFFLSLFTIPTKLESLGVTKYILFLLISVLFTCAICMSEEETPYYVTFILYSYWGIFIAGSYFGGVIARYTYRNFQEVVSRRMLYRNSNVSLFEIKWRYVLDRFTNITCSLILCFIYLLLIILFSIGAVLTDFKQ
jgi:hypothetical protein